MRSTRSRGRVGAVAAAAVLVGIAPAVPVGAAVRSDQDCWDVVWAVTGHDRDGNPRYGWEQRNTCRASAGSGGGGGDGSRTCQHATRGEVPCHDPVWGWWSDVEQCYVRLLAPQPPAGDPAWEGNRPADGAVYQFHCPGDRLASGMAQRPGEVRVGFLADAPGLPSVAQLARRAMASLVLAGPDIGIAPSPEGTGLVGMPVWLWTNEAATTWGPVSVTVPGPGITVTAEGNATRIEWDMGDGHTVVCDGPGEPYRAAYGAAAPDCGHVYAAPSVTQPDGRYPVTAATTWRVRWWVEPRGSGAGGEDFYRRESATLVRIHELQVVTS